MPPLRTTSSHRSRSDLANPNKPSPPSAANAAVGTQGTSNNYHTNRVDWTPIFARGKILIYCIDRDVATTRDDLPEKLTDSKNLAKFIKNVLPGLLEKMKRKYGWSDLPRTLVHDKASYMVPPMHNRLQRDFAEALRQSGFRSWVGTKADSAKRPVRKFVTYTIRFARVHKTTRSYCLSTRRRKHTTTLANARPPSGQPLRIARAVT